LEKVKDSRTLTLCEGETLFSMLERWRKLLSDFSRKGTYNISKISYAQDCIKYDMIHNQPVLNLSTAPIVFEALAPLADYMIPQEYGVSAEEKIAMASEICKPLTKKILFDLCFARDGGHSSEYGFESHSDPAYATKNVRTRLYFTSESHVQTLLNVFRYIHLCSKGSSGEVGGKKGILPPEALEILDQISDLNYLTHIVLRLHEDMTKPKHDHTRYRVELLFSPGVKNGMENIDWETHSTGHNNLVSLTSLPLHEFETHLGPFVST